MVTFWLQETGGKMTVVGGSMTKLTRDNNHTATELMENSNHTAIGLNENMNLQLQKDLFICPSIGSNRC